MMKLFPRAIVVLVAMNFSHVASAYHDDDTDWAKKEAPIAVAVPKNVKQKINELPQAEKKRVTEANQVGTSFLQQYLDGMLCYDDPNPTAASKELIKLTVDIFHIGENCSRFKSPEVPGYETYKATKREMCPQISLIEFTFKNDGVSLTYEMTKLGSTVWGGDNIVTFVPNNSGEKESIVIDIAASNRVADMYLDEWDREEAYGMSLSSFKNKVADAEVYFKHPVPRLDSTPAEFKKAYLRHKEVIKQIEHQAALVCK